MFLTDFVKSESLRDDCESSEAASQTLSLPIHPD